MGPVVVEFYGMPRQRAGRVSATLQADTVAEVLAALRLIPGLGDVQRPDGSLAAHYLLSLDGQRFLGALEEPLRPGSHLLLLSADVGG